jgi:hypothetical protein
LVTLLLYTVCALLKVRRSVSLCEYVVRYTHVDDSEYGSGPPKLTVYFQLHVSEVILVLIIACYSTNVGVQ